MDEMGKSGTKTHASTFYEENKGKESTADAANKILFDL